MTTSERAAPGATTGRRERLFTRPFGLVMAGTALAWFAHTMAVMLMAPFVVRLGFDAAVGGFGAGIVALTALLSRIVVGPRIDRRDGRIPTIIGAGLIALGATAYLVTALLAGPSRAPLAIAAVGALLHGAGFGAMSTATFTLIDDAAPRSRRGEAVGYYGATPPIIQGLAATVGFILVEAGGFSLLFGVVAVAALASLALFAGLHPSPVQTVAPRVRHPGARRSFYAGIAIPVLATGLLAVVSGALILAVPLLGLSVGISNPGVFYLTSAVSGVSARLLTGRISDRFGRVRVAVPGLLLLSASMVALGLLAGTGVGSFVIGGLVFGLASAAAVPALQALVLDRSPADHRGTGAAAMGMALDVGFASGSMATGIVIGIAGPANALLTAAAAPLISLGLLALDHHRSEGRRAPHTTGDGREPADA